MKIILFSIPFCRVYYLVCSIMLLWMLGAKITGPETIFTNRECDEPFLRPGYYTLVMMYDEGQWHKVFAEDKSKECPEGYTWDNVYRYYTHSASAWPTKPIGKVICWTTMALFVLVLLSPFWHRWKSQIFLFAFLSASIILFFYWLHLERGDKELYLLSLQSGEYKMTIPCLLVWASCLYRIIFCRRMHWDQKVTQQTFTVFLMKYHQRWKQIAMISAIITVLLLFCYPFFAITFQQILLFAYIYAICMCLAIMSGFIITLSALLIFLFPKKVAMLLV